MSDVRVSWGQFDTDANVVCVSWCQFDPVASTADVKVSWCEFNPVASVLDVKVAWCEFNPAATPEIVPVIKSLPWWRGADTERRIPRPKAVTKIIRALAKKQVKRLREEEQEFAYTQQLITALAKADLQYREVYGELLQQERERLIEVEIARLLHKKKVRDEEEEVLAFLMSVL